MVMIHDYLRQTAAAGSRKPIGNVTFEMAPVSQENVKEFVTKLGTRDWQRIPFHRFAYAPGGYDFSLSRILALLGK